MHVIHYVNRRLVQCRLSSSTPTDLCRPISSQEVSKAGRRSLKSNRTPGADRPVGQLRVAGNISPRGGYGSVQRPVRTDRLLVNPAPFPPSDRTILVIILMLKIIGGVVIVCRVGWSAGFVSAAGVTSWGAREGMYPPPSSTTPVICIFQLVKYETLLTWLKIFLACRQRGRYHKNSVLYFCRCVFP